MEVPNRARGILRANWRTYVAANLMYYGLILAGMVVAAVFPAVQRAALHDLNLGFESGLLALVSRVYRSGNVALAALLTFAVNGGLGAFGQMTLPSAAIPFFGCLMAAFRAAMWGVTLSPTSLRMFLALAPHSLTILLEGQAYVVAALGCYLWGKWLLWPHAAGFANRKEAYLAGLRANLRLYKVVLALLAVSAVYESVEVISMIKLAQHFRS